MKPFFLLVFLLCSAGAFSQKVALKNNLTYDTLKTTNLSLEFSMRRKWTLDTQVGMNFFFLYEGRHLFPVQEKKLSHWLVRPELRYWTYAVFNDWFFGLHTHGGQMNIGDIDVPFVLQKGDGNMKDHRYEGYFWGGGLSAGYQWVISNRLNIEASLGIGYVHARYDKYRCTTCGQKLDKGDADYIGPIKTAISIIYMLKSPLSPGRVFFILYHAKKVISMKPLQYFQIIILARCTSGRSCKVKFPGLAE